MDEILFNGTLQSKMTLYLNGEHMFKMTADGEPSPLALINYQKVIKKSEYELNGDLEPPWGVIFNMFRSTGKSSNCAR